MNVAQFVACETETEGEPEVDAVEEFRLRIWARQNYTPAENRDVSWHPVVLEEMERKDREN